MNNIKITNRDSLADGRRKQKVREYAFVNDIGERVSLMEGVMLFDVSGMGFDSGTSYSEVSSGFFVAGQKADTQGQISGTLVIPQPNAYNKYATLVNWLMSGHKLKLAYNCTGDELYTDVDIKSLQKSEIKNGVVKSGMVLTCLSPWYKLSPQRLVMTADDTPLNYPRTYDYKYGISYLANGLQFTVGGHMEGALQFRLPGPITSPVITVKHNGAVIGRMDLTGTTIASGDTLEWSTVPSNCYIRTTGSAETDLINACNVADTNFPRLPQGDIEIELSVSGDRTTQAEVDIYEYFRAV